jgi:transcriptional regulator with XRE-family HTH domain
MPERTSEQILMTAFGNAVRKLRRDRGWSQEDFADRVGVHRTYMGGVERGERNVSLVNIGRISESLELPLAALMAEVDRALASRS